MSSSSISWNPVTKTEVLKHGRLRLGIQKGLLLLVRRESGYTIDIPRVFRTATAVRFRPILQAKVSHLNSPKRIARLFPVTRTIFASKIRRQMPSVIDIDITSCNPFPQPLLMLVLKFIRYHVEEYDQKLPQPLI